MASALHRPRTDARRQQQLREVLRSAIRRRREIATQAARVDVFRADVVMRRHDQMRQQRLLRRSRSRCSSAASLSRDSIGAEPIKQLELRAA